MSPRPFPDPVLSLATNSIGKLDSLDVDNLSCIWTVFTKCAENLENGRRLENLSWRLWCKSVSFFLHNTVNDMVFHHTSSQPLKDKILYMPELSVSVDSTSSLDEHEIKGKISDYHPPNVSMLMQTSLNKPNTVRCVSPGQFQKIITNFMSFRMEAERRKNSHNEAIKTSDSYKQSNSDSQEKDNLSLTVPDVSQSISSYKAPLLSSNTHHLSTTNLEKLQSDTLHPNPTHFNISDTSKFCSNNVSSHNIENHSIELPQPTEKQDKMFFIQETSSSESFTNDKFKSDVRSNATKSSCQLMKSKSTKRISFQMSDDTPSSALSDTKQQEYNSFPNLVDDDNDWDSICGSSKDSLDLSKSSIQSLNYVDGVYYKPTPFPVRPAAMSILIAEYFAVQPYLGRFCTTGRLDPDLQLKKSLMARGLKKHLKRINAPSHWLIDKLGGTYAPRPSPGPHKLRDCLPLIIFLRNRLKYALNSRETIAILMQRLIKVDGKVRTDHTYPAG
ncbi:hypothetical protein PCK1_002402, partial [Pneumocystis canis]